MVVHGKCRNNACGYLGYTLLELLVVLSIAAVLLGFALTPLYTLMGRTALENSVTAWKSDYHFAQSQAITRGETLILCPSHNGKDCATSARDYSQGWMVRAEKSGLVVRDYPLDPSDANPVEITSNVANSSRFLRFAADGVSPSAGAFQTLRFRNAQGQICLTLASSGRLRQGECLD